MKKYIVILFIALIGGAFIWSCSQDDLDNGQPIYHYSAEQLAEIRALAEEYDVPEVKYATASEKGLPTVEEMKEIFIKFAIIKSVLNQPLEISDKSQTHINFRTRHSLVPRKHNIGGETFTGSKDVSQMIYAGSDACWLHLVVSWEGTNATDPYTKLNVTVEARFEIGPSVPPTFQVKNEKTDWHWEGSNSIIVDYSCTLEDESGVEAPINISESIDVNVEYP